MSLFGFNNVQWLVLVVMFVINRSDKFSNGYRITERPLYSVYLKETDPAKSFKHQFDVVKALTAAHLGTLPVATMVISDENNRALSPHRMNSMFVNY